MLTGSSPGSWDAIWGQEEILSKCQVWRLKVCGTPLAQSLRAPLGPEDGFPEGIKGDWALWRVWNNSHVCVFSAEKFGKWSGKI